MAQAAKKRRQVLMHSLADSSHVSERGLARIIQKLHTSNLSDLGAPISLAQVRRDLAATSGESFNSLQTTVMLRQLDGSTVPLKVCSPQRVLQHFVQEAPVIKELVRRKLEQHGANIWRLLVYHDEVTPGNVLRPDNKRKICVLYMSFAEFELLLRDELMWFPVAVARHDTISNTKGGLSGVLLCMFQSFFADMHAGIYLACLRVVLQFRFSNMIADEDALRAAWSVKGASGIRPCMLCKNVVMRDRQADDPYLIDIAEHDPLKFDLMTDADWYLVADHLMQQRAVLNKGAFDMLEKTVGLNCNLDGLLFDPEMRQIVTPLSSTYDSMHSYFNHGAASNETHAFLETAQRECGLTYKMIRDFIDQSKWRCPKHLQVNPSKVFSETRGRASKETMKGMASELLSVLPLLKQLAATVLTQDSIAKERTSFLALCECVDIMQDIKKLQDPPEHLINKLGLAQQQHLQLHKLAYGTMHARPKNHYCMHLPAQIRRDRILLDVFTHERKNKNAKRIATLCPVSDKFEQAVLQRLLQEQLGALRNDERMFENRLIGTQLSCPEVAEACNVPECKMAERAWCDGYHVSVGDVFLTMCEGAEVAMQVHACVELPGKHIRFLTQQYKFHQHWGHAKQWSKDRATLLKMCSNTRFTSYWTEDEGLLITLA